VAVTGDTYRHPTGDPHAHSTRSLTIGDHMEKPHIPTIAELEALFAEDTTPLTYRAPPDPARLRKAVLAFLSAWDEELSIRNLHPFVEEVRKAIEGRP
jgi:hypothetical protein